MAILWNAAASSAWAPATPYATNARALNGGNVYIATTGGVSFTGTGPAGTGSAILDGSVTWAYLGMYAGSVVDVASELATGSPAITAGAQTVFLALAEKLVADPAIWIGGLLDYGRLYLAAHFGELSRLRGHGPITAESVGPISRSYASLMGPFAVDLTAAGRMYMDLVRTTPAVFGVNA